MNENTQMLIRLIVGLSGTAIVGFFALKRCWWLYRLIKTGQKTGDERTTDIPTRILTQLREVAGQAKLLKWSIPGTAHFFTMWAFIVLLTVYIEAYGLLFKRDFALPLIGHSDILGFLQDFFICAVTIAIIVFMIIRIQRNPATQGRASRFYGSHNGGAWLILIMIANVVWTYCLLRGAEVVDGTLPYGKGAFLSHFFGHLQAPLGVETNEWIATIALLLHIAIMLAFLLIVLHSKHLHIFLAPINVTFKRLPNALGPLLPLEYQGKPIDFDNPPEDAVFGRGKIEDFTWKGMLDFATCTECGRCQSQCPAWNTDKPLSPKLVIMDLRDHWMAKAPYLLGEKPMPTGEVDLSHAPKFTGHHVPEKGFERIAGSGPEQAVRPLVGTAEQGGVIDPNVLWSCTNCGACVEQCPVDIEHIDHIVDMRRYQVLVDSEFPSELGILFKNLETKGNPWGQNAKERLTWIDELDFDIPVYGQDVDSFEGFEYLFWIGCAGAYEDKAKNTTKVIAQLLAAAGVKFLVLGTNETCTGDPARRCGNEFLFQQLAQQNVDTLNDLFEGVPLPQRKIITSCPHCFNALYREYPQLGSHYVVLHHSQVLNRLVRDKKLIPVSPISQSVTYHDPCFLGRHNKVYEPPRELVASTGVSMVEMPRNHDRSFCCGAGGARMWMEEHLGQRINHNRVDEALSTGANIIATACPFCRVMMQDGVGDRQEAAGRSNVEVRDIAQMLLDSLDLRNIQLPPKGTAAAAAAQRVATRPAAPSVSPPEKTPDSSPLTSPAPAASESLVDKPVTGLGIATKAKRPGARKPGASSPSNAEESSSSSPGPVPTKGLGMAGGAKRPGARKGAAGSTPTSSSSSSSQTLTPPASAVPVKGLGMAGGAKRPGARKGAAGSTPTSSSSSSSQTPTSPAPSAASDQSSTPTAVRVKGLGLATTARRPGAGKRTSPAVVKDATDSDSSSVPTQDSARDADCSVDGTSVSSVSSTPTPTVISTPGLPLRDRVRPPGRH